MMVAWLVDGEEAGRAEAGHVPFPGDYVVLGGVEWLVVRRLFHLDDPNPYVALMIRLPVRQDPDF